MRKDVKFGLTIAAILLVTLTVYLIVLSRGGGSGQIAGVANPTASSDNGAAPNPKGESGSMETGDASAKPSNPAESPAPEGGNPATQPSASANPKFDWNDALRSGGTQLSAAAPQRTVTPPIASVDGSPVRRPAALGPEAHPALIDNAPATRPDDDSLVTPPAAAGAAQDAPRTHVVASGESFWTISAAVYGDSKYYTKIIAANPNVDPKHLKVGTVLTIPPLGDAQSSSAASSGDKIDPATQYQVVSGDSLEAIAVKLYGKPAMKDNLYELNRALIGADENRLKVGWILKLPEPPSK
ncbi:MAG: LysM peptidoglycan-binding domain-containing protein [Tepidisphaeraceae bacterium]|jgi:nucleoid-associated protein YgaU